MSLFNPINWGSMFAGLFGGGIGSEQDRFRRYARFLRAYEGYRTPGGLNPSRSNAETALQMARLRFNFNRPIVELGASFLVGDAVTWKIDPDGKGDQAEARAQEIADKAFDIWDRSGSDRAILQAARSGGIYGDMVALATLDAEGQPRIEFVSPDLCTPKFRGNDAQKLERLTIAWTEEDEREQRTNHREEITADGREKFVNDVPVPEESAQFDGRIPAAWIRNLSLKGQSYGISDLDGVVDLVEAYDHVMTKRERIIDYYAAPTIVFEGLRKGDLEKDTNTVLYLPASTGTGGGKRAYFLEWAGAPPDIELQLDRIRNDIAEVSQVPAVAFGRQDSGLSTISGVALRILYGPLLAKTDAKRASWGPELEYVMWLCLRKAGYPELRLEQVNIQWPDPVPVNEKELAETEKTLVDAGLRSVRTAMKNLGVEDADAEFARVQEERMPVKLKELQAAGLSLEASLDQMGVQGEMRTRLLRRDTVDDITQ